MARISGAAEFRGDDAVPIAKDSRGKESSDEQQFIKADRQLIISNVNVSLIKNV